MSLDIFSVYLFSVQTTKPAAPKLSNFNPHLNSAQITTIRLNGSNFLHWSQSVCLYIRGREKIGYMTSETTEPEKLILPI